MPATIKKGSEGPDVRAVQEALRALYWPPGRDDGVFDDATEAAVRMFQRHIGLTVDGVVGPRTYAALDRAAHETRGRIWGRGGPRRPRVDGGPLGDAWEALEQQVDGLVEKMGLVEDAARAKTAALAQALGYVARDPAAYLAYLKETQSPDVDAAPEGASNDAARAAAIHGLLSTGVGPRRVGEALEQLGALQTGGRTAEVISALRALLVERGADREADALFAGEARVLGLLLRAPDGAGSAIGLYVAGAGGQIKEIGRIGSLDGRPGGDVGAASQLEVEVVRGDAARMRGAGVEVTLAGGQGGASVVRLRWALDFAAIASGAAAPLDRARDYVGLVVGVSAAPAGAANAPARATSTLWP